MLRNSRRISEFYTGRPKSVGQLGVDVRRVLPCKVVSNMVLVAGTLVVLDNASATFRVVAEIRMYSTL
jgi:hypothetical protein